MAWASGDLSLPTATTTGAVTGLGFQPKGILFVFAAASGADWTSLGVVGAGDNGATTQWCRGVFWDAVLAETVVRDGAVDGAVWTGYDESGGEAVLKVTSLDADGFSWSLDEGSATIPAGQMVAWFATDDPVYVGTAAFAGTANPVSVSGFGFAPQGTLVLSGPVATDGGMHVGASDGTNSWVGGVGLNDATSVQTWARWRTGAVGFVQSTTNYSTLNVTASVTTDADGLTFTPSSTAPNGLELHYVAFDSPVKAGVLTTNTSTGAQALTGAGFAPKVALLNGIHSFYSAWFTATPITGNTTDAVDGSWSLGVAHGSSFQRVSRHRFAQGSSNNITTRRVVGKAIALVDKLSDSTERATASITSFDSDGLTLDWTATYTPDNGMGTREVAYLLLGDSQEPPNAPTLVAPADGATVDLAAGTTFDWTFSDPNAGDTQSAYALRRKVSGAGSYEYWDASSSTWSGTEVKNVDTATAVTFGASKWTNGNTYNWSVKVWDSTDLASGYANDFTVTGGTAPTVTSVEPTGTVSDTTQPTVTWVYSDAESHVQQSYRVKVFTASQGDPENATGAVVDSGTVTSAATSYALPSALSNETTYYVYVKATDSTGQASAWASASFTISLDAPAAPVVTTTVEADQGRVRLDVQGTDNLLSVDVAAMDPAAWSDGAGATIVGASAQTPPADAGSAAMEVALSGNGTTNQWFVPPSNSGRTLVPVGEYVRGVVWLKVDVGLQVRVDLHFANEAGTYIGQGYSETVTGTGDWQRVDVGPGRRNDVDYGPALFVTNDSVNSAHTVHVAGAKVWPDDGQPVNLLSSASAEQRTFAGWSAWYGAHTATRVAGAGYRGTDAVAWADSDTPNLGGILSNPFFRVEAGATYSFGAWMHPGDTGADVSNGRIGIYWYDVNGATIGSSAWGYADAAGDDGWVRVSGGGFVAPAGAVKSRLAMDVDFSTFPNPAGTLYVSLAQAEQAATLSGYATPPVWSRGGLAGVSTMTVERSRDGGTTWATVRDASGQEVDAAATQLVTVYDYEYTPGEQMLYRARASAEV